MIKSDELCFPNNVVNLIAMRAGQVIDPADTIVIKRPVDVSDPDQTISVVPAGWTPGSVVEMGPRHNRHEEVFQDYTIMVQTLINDMEEERAIQRHSLFSTMVRRMLYRDRVLLGALSRLRVEDEDIVETTTKFSVRSQQFLVNQKDASFQYLSVIEFYLQTQIQNKE